MPLSRYQIRNEYSLADPELYRTADKDDPEAVLEGIAMAGLVGVLRQLGDLAEFAAEIFHDLHEQVMVTASRGHNLMVRVQQLEVEFPAIEKALLCQTNHSSSYYNTGTDWHPNLRMDHNLITEGDLPRFVMDSYEECRGPPRLFLLDKFDVAGDGATLKRYTDPSFFKVEASFSNVVRDKKTRKAKRKASRWRKGETPETLPTSHAKLHQLFMEERLENGTTHGSTSRVKLKRRLNGFPFDTKSGKSYMEKFLKSPSPNHDEVHEISEDLSPLSFPSNNDYQSALEVVEVSVSSPEKESKQRMRNSDSPPGEETALALVSDELNEVSTGENCLEVSEPNLGLQLYEISSTSHAVLSERDITVEGESKMDDSINDNQSDDVASEIDNYVDALASMDSENDTDSELRTKSNLHFMSSIGHPSASSADAEDVQVQAHSADSLSVGNSTLSDDGSSSSKKDVSSFYSSDTHSASAENIPDAEDTLNVQASDVHVAEPSPKHMSEEGELSQLPESSTSSGPNESGSPNISVLVDENAEVIVEDTTPVGAERDAMVTFSRDLPFKSRYTDVCNPSGSPNDSVLVNENAEVIVEDTTSVGVEREAMVTFSRDIPFISRYTDVCDTSGEYLPPILPGESLDDLHESATKIDGTSTYHSIPPSPSRQTSLLQVPGEKQLIGGEEIAVASTADGFIAPGTTDDRNSSHAEILLLNELVDVENSAVAINHSAGHLHKRDDESPTSSSCNLSQGGFGVEVPDYDLDVSDGVSDTMEVAAEKPNSENVLDSKIQFPHVDGNLDEHIVGSQNSDLPLSREQLSDPISEELDTGYSTTVVGGRVSEEDNSTLLAGEIDPCNSKDEAYVEEHEMKERTLNLIDEFCDVPSNVVDGAIVATSVSDSDLIASDTTAGTVLMVEVHVQADGVDHESVTIASTISSNDGDESVKKVHEEFSSIPDEHSGVTNDTLHSSKPLESEVLDDAHQLHGMGMDDDLGLQVCNDDDIFNRSGAESGGSIDIASTTESSAVQYEQSPLCEGVEIDLQPGQMGGDLCSNSDNSFSALPLAHVPHSNDHLEMSDDTSEFLQKNLSGPSSVSEQLSLDGSKIDVSEQRVDLSNPISSSPPLQPYSDPIHAEDAPPLPPLPPVQWLGDNQNACPVQESIVLSDNATAFSPPLSSSVNEEAQHAIPFLPQPSLSDVNLSVQPVCSTSSLLSTIPPLVHQGDQEDTLLPMERLQLPTSVSQSSESPGEILHNIVQDDEVGEVERNSEVHIMDSAKSIGLFGEEYVKPLNQMAVETNSSGLEHGLQSAHLEEIVSTSDTTKTSATIVNDGLRPTLEESVSQPINGGMQNGGKTTKPPLPRNPLIDAIADVAHDKSKLRKVPERVQPQMKGEEKSSMLAQIRNQSFNLKRAPAARANVQGPPVNLNVVSLMSKVNKVLLTNRQAMAGSDDEDDDWDP